jgi:hypothetical protein
MRAVVVAIALALIGSVGLATGDTSAQSSPTVTLSVYRLYDSGNRLYRLRFNGTISSRAAGQYVTVMRQTCGLSFATALAGATTRAGGFWEAETTHAPRPELDTNTYFARWGTARSAPVKFRGRLVMGAIKLSPKKVQIWVDRGESRQDMTGRRVVLQRLLTGRWSPVATAKLRLDQKRAWVYSATFALPARGWTLRAVVPAKNARPCFNQSTTERFKS